MIAIMDNINTGLKIAMIALGSISGASAAFMFVPARTIRDGVIKCVACVMVTSCVTSAIVRGLARVIEVSSASVPDLLLALSCVFGLCSQWIINALIDLSRQDSKSAIQNILKAFFPWIKPPAEPPPPPQ